MNLLGRIASRVTGGKSEPAGSIRVVDPSPLNWLWITYNTVEELVRVSPSGVVGPAAMKSFRWKDDRTLEVDVRPGNRFRDGEAITAGSVKTAFDEMMRWEAPHPPGTHFNIDLKTRCEVAGEHQVRFHLPEVDGLAPGKLRAMHLMSSPFWKEVGFGYLRNQTGEGRW